MDNHISRELALRRITIVEPTGPLISSPLGFVPKHDGSYRRIHHLSHPPGKSVNDYIGEASSSITYSTIQHILQRIRQSGQGSILLKRDIKDAFRNIPLAASCQWLLGFSWRQQYYKERVLPFGLATAPFIFNLFAEAFHWILQSWLGWRQLEHYLDDFILILPPNTNPQELQAIEADYIVVTDILGIPRKDSKNECGTTAHILGYEINTITGHLLLPQEKVTRAYTLASQALLGDSLTIREAQAIAGLLNFCSPAVQLGRIFTTEIWLWIASFPTKSSQFTRRRLSAGIKNDLYWWRDLLQQFNGTLFYETVARKRINLYTDASGTHKGGYWFQVGQEAEQRHAFISAHTPNRRLDINEEEMGAIRQAFQIWGSHWASCEVRIYTDNTTAAIGLSSSSTHGRALPELRAILLLAARNDIIIRPQWIPGNTNSLADALSRRNIKQIADLQPLWQMTSFNSITFPPTGPPQSITQHQLSSDSSTTA